MSEESSVANALNQAIQGSARPILINVALFVAGIALIKSSVMDNLAPQ